MTPRRLLTWCAAALALCTASSVLAAGRPEPMPAHPDLLQRLGPKEVARLYGKVHTPQMTADLRLESTAKAAALTGTGTCLVILWEFTDHPADQVNHPSSAYQDMMFSAGTFPTGSMNDYYLEVSHGAFGVAGQIVGWTTAANTYASYANGDGSQDPYTAREMIRDAVAQLDPYVDFAQFDNDGPDGIPDSGDDDGLVDALFFVHAGPGQEQSGNTNDIWSHAWAISGGLATNDGVMVYRYSVEPEEFTDGSMITVGVFAHEYGHVLGLPDLYDTDYSSQGIGEWGLMSGGSWTRRDGGAPGSSPTHLTAWSKAQLGWVTPVEITVGQTGLVVPPAETNAVAYKFFKDGFAGGDEYFLVENRRRLGFDEGLLRRQQTYGFADPEGLIIYHVDEAASGNSNDQHRLVDVVDASPWFDGLGGWWENLDAPQANYAKVSGFNRGDNGDLWPGFTAFTADSTQWVEPRDRTAFSDATVPGAGDYECNPSGLSLTNIALVGTDVVLDVAFAPAGAGAPAHVATAGVWDFETGVDQWQFCNSYAHWDQSQAGSCAGAGGLWFGTTGWSNCGGVGYGNNWNDFAWITVGVPTAATSQVELTHRYELEPGYDYGYLEVRPWGDAGAGWTTLATFNGNSGCVSGSWPIPGSVLAAGDPDGNGTAAVDVRLRLTSDGGWSSEDGSFCGVGWWVDRVAVTELYPAGTELPSADGLAALLAPVPNPFNPRTTLRYHVPTDARAVELAVFDQRGRLVRRLTAAATPGWHEVVWDGRTDAGARAASGLYFARLVTDGAAQTRKMVLVQ
ncbi:MAG: M6 family metalloprotease domain-containing protein [Candidatus Krumholzibacteriia bacterium]